MTASLTETISFTVTPQLREAIERAAKQDSRTVGNWLRLVVQSHLEVEKR